MKKTIDVITSAYNEEDCLPELFTRLNSVSQLELNYHFRFIVIDNGSQDRTWTLIKGMSKIDSRFVGM